MSTSRPKPSPTRPDPTHSPARGKPDSSNDVLPGLYIVATPIGNARDITLRALDVLRDVDVIACEDTRVTSKLMTLHDIDTPLISYHDHNARRVLPSLIERLKNGERVAQVSDAGTPLIADPGYRLVNACRDANIPVTAIPGASSVTTALVAAGIATDRFTFVGFVPTKAGERTTWLRDVLATPGTIVAFESAKRLPASLKAVASEGPNRDMAVCRELTKRFEEVRRGTAADLAEHYDQAGPPKGEVVLVIGGAALEDVVIDDAVLDAALIEALAQYRVKDAAQAVAESFGVSRKRVYARALQVSKPETE